MFSHGRQRIKTVKLPIPRPRAKSAAPPALRRQVGRYARPAIVGTLIGSAAMNAFVFAAQAGSPWILGEAVTLGVAIPA
jgi:hypothetical protein